MPTSPAKQIPPSIVDKTHLPRAQRLSLHTQVRYRTKGLGLWRKGIVENLSQSGIFFHGPMRLPEYALVEMVFEMPEEISGQKHRTVLCQGRILRRGEVGDCGAVGLAASILDYTFLPASDERSGSRAEA
ncbi:MAG TPA: PilZ domain-containing protein [Terriglobales bacterium]|nr:PilZ domain-containing protein [Terriglobales bacterium]